MMLGSDDIPLRLAAAENARLAEPSASLVTALQNRFAKDESPAVRARAIDALGQVAPKDSAELFDQAGQSQNILIRAAAVRAWTAARSSAKVANALDDPSPLVRLQAIFGAETLSLDDSCDRFVELMLAAPDEPTHQAARRALAGMDRDDLKRRIAEALDKALTDGSKRANQLDRLSKVKNPKPAQVARQQRITRLADRLDRNAASCCWLLGHWGEKTIGYETLLSVLERVKLDSPVLGQAAWALGRIGRAEAAEPLAKTLERCKKRGVIYLRAMAAMRMGPPYSEEVTAEVAVALARLGHRPSMEAMVYIARTRVMGTLLSRATRGVIEALGILMTEADRPMVTELCAEILETPAFSLETHAAAAVLVGREKLTAAAPAVRVMFDRRETRTTMNIAAWAIGELTGETPEIPQPIQNQGNWILRELE
jgi:HEAT repeat protein